MNRIHEKKPTQQMKGWTLPTTLFGVALLLSSVHLLTFELIDARKMIAEMFRGEDLHQGAISEITKNRSTGGRCTDVTISSDSSHPPYEVCGEERSPFISRPSSGIEANLLIDYDALFSSSSTCPTVPVTTELPYHGAPRARNDCLLPSTLRNGITLLENIRGESLTISPPSTGFVLLASPGSFSVSGELTIASDLLIVAGGDVELGGIRGPSSSTLRVTIISSLGGIRVRTVHGLISLIVAGRRTLEVPETLTASSFPLPPVRVPSLYSFRAVARDGG